MKRTLGVLAAIAAAATITLATASEANAKCWAPSTAPSVTGPSTIELWCK
jgi:hypothetical protein